MKYMTHITIHLQVLVETTDQEEAEQMAMELVESYNLGCPSVEVYVEDSDTPTGYYMAEWVDLND